VGSHLETITWPGSYGPEQYFAPVYEFPLEERHAFTRPGHRLREYDERDDVWPQCHHKKPCVVQMYDDWIDAGRRFFRCPDGYVSTTKLVHLCEKSAYKISSTNAGLLRRSKLSFHQVGRSSASWTRTGVYRLLEEQALRSATKGPKSRSGCRAKCLGN